jgi:hypothetical protein
MVAALVFASGFAFAQTGSPAAKSSKTATHKATASKSSKKVASKSKGRRSRKGAWKRHGQQKIDPARARQIQEALVREKYLDGEPSGVWDARTEQAMVRYQSDHGWQSKITPDSRALIKLGLGPDHSQDVPVGSGAQARTPVTAVTGRKR